MIVYQLEPKIKLDINTRESYKRKGIMITDYGQL